LRLRRRLRGSGKKLKDRIGLGRKQKKEKDRRDKGE